MNSAQFHYDITISMQCSDEFSIVQVKKGMLNITHQFKGKRVYLLT